MHSYTFFVTIEREINSKYLILMYLQQQNTLYPQKVADFAKRMSCVTQIYAMLTPPTKKKKDLPFIIGCEPIRSFKKLFSQNLPPLG